MQNTVSVVAGLGNPGKKYENTRHNIGFAVLDELSRQYTIPLTKEKFGTVYGRGRVEAQDVFLLKPQNFMNRSGPPVSELITWYRLTKSNIVVIHDDMDLEFGRIKIKEKGGSGGHKGIKSLMDALGGGDFVRIRMGIGHPAPCISVTDYVLGKFRQEESGHLDEFIKRGREALVTVLCKGTKEGMNAFNRKSLIVLQNGGKK
ncbi:MAG: aminoacyl-tRNA hydrolase [Desulfococcaceae bacterium]|jgi:PTH1 family peptidyl-tRNA hydrolase|nr:aminoacyl-tRNA hydrolase [Desulfococcaceae bacterium]